MNGDATVSTWFLNRFVHAEDAAGLVKPPHNKHDNIVNVDFASSVAEADAVLARFGYVERGVAIAA